MTPDPSATDPGTPVAAALRQLDATLGQVRAATAEHASAQEALFGLLGRLEAALEGPGRGTGAELKGLRWRLKRAQKRVTESAVRLKHAQAACRAAYVAGDAVIAAMSGDRPMAVPGQANNSALETALAWSLRALVDLRLRDARTAHQGAQFDTPDGSFGYVAIPDLYFMEGLLALDRALTTDPDFVQPGARYRPVRFVEVGCGHGRNLFLVRTSGILSCESIAGFDIDHANVDIGKAAFGLDGSVFVADALSFDYSGCDVIFCYRPFTDDALQERLEACVVEGMPEGGYLFAPLSQGLGQYAGLNRLAPNSPIWKKAAP